jgi:hypothetical protein
LTNFVADLIDPASQRLDSLLTARFPGQVIGDPTSLIGDLLRLSHLCLVIGRVFASEKFLLVGGDVVNRLTDIPEILHVLLRRFCIGSAISQGSLCVSDLTYLLQSLSNLL